MGLARACFGRLLIVALPLLAAPVQAAPLDTVVGRFEDDGFLKSQGLEDVVLSLETASGGKQAGFRLAGAGALPDLFVEFDTAVEWRAFVEAWRAARQLTERGEVHFTEATTEKDDRVIIWLADDRDGIDLGIMESQEQVGTIFGLAAEDVDAFDASIRTVSTYFEE